MNPFKDIRRLIAPFMRGLPFIVSCCVVVVIIVLRMVSYQVPFFESEAKIKIDSHGNGFSDNNLYNDLDIFSETNEVLSEVELLKSPVIIDRALAMLPSMVEYYRVGQLRTSEMYKDSPFEIVANSQSFEHYDELITLDIHADSSFKMIFSNGENVTGQIGQTVCGMEVTVNQDTEGSDLHLVDKYEFRVNTLRGLRSNFVEGNLLIKEVDKDINVVRVYFEGEHPEKVADFTNAICDSYLEDHVAMRTKAATLTSNFLEIQLQDLEKKLKSAENDLEAYRLENDVLDIRVEIETGLKKLSELEIQKANLEIKVRTLDTLIGRIKNDVGSFLEAAPAFEAHGGLVYLEFVKNLRRLLAEKTELEKQYTTNSFELKSNRQEIETIEKYLLESLESHRAEAVTEISTLSNRFAEINESYDDMPTKEKRIVELERSFIQYQDAYNFIKKKSIESQIAKVAEINFHRVIQKAEVSELPASPKPSFLIAMALFVTLVITTLLCYLLDFAKGVVKGVYDLSLLPLMGVFSQDGNNGNSANVAYLYSKLFDNKKSVKAVGFVPCFEEMEVAGVVLEVSSYLASVGNRIAIVSHESNQLQPDLFGKPTSAGIEYFRYTSDELIAVSIQKKIDGLGGVVFAHFDYIFFVTGGAIVEPHIQVLSPYLDRVVLAAEHGVTKKKHLSTAVELIQKVDQGGEKQGVLLLGAPRFLNYDGSFIGMKYTLQKNLSVFNKIKALYTNYMNSWWV